MTRIRRPRTRAAAAIAILLVVAGAAATLLLPRPTPAPIVVGAVFPLSGSAGSLARQEALGVSIAADMVNADGGVDGHQIVLEMRDLERSQDAPAAMAALRARGAHVVIGAYSSDLSIAASSAAADAGLVYWEAGAVADRLTGRGLSTVFRVGASGTNLGSNSAAFAVTQLAPRLGRTAATLRVAVVAAQDDYARSVADAAIRQATAAAVPIVARASYDLALPRWPQVMARLAAARPDVIILASHIPDGIAFRRAMLAAKLKVGALIGSTMAECSPDFAGDLGADAIGIFASDRPTGGFQPSVLRADARATYQRLATAWAQRAGLSPSPTPAGESRYGEGAGAKYAIQGPITGSPGGVTEEGLSGFSAAWALFHEVLPGVARTGDLDAAGIAAGARALDLPVGSLPNGAGIQFSKDPATLGQNQRATAVIWQWQAVRSYTFVWPSAYATGSIGLVPLPR